VGNQTRKFWFLSLKFFPVVKGKKHIAIRQDAEMSTRVPGADSLFSLTTEPWNSVLTPCSVKRAEVIKKEKGSIPGNELHIAPLHI
jgi:hypothetical protein